MKRTIYIIVAVIAIQMLGVSSLWAQTKKIEEIDYRRSSIYSILINHTEQKYGKYVADVFIDMPLPDKYNDHDLSVKIVEVNYKTKATEKGKNFLDRNQVASHLVGRWFNRDPFTGQCDMELIKERGLYNASEFDKIIASKTIRGNSLLEDAGEDLIQNTFVIVNDIRYIDKEKAGQIAGMIFQVLLAVAGAATSAVTNTNYSNSFNALGEGMNALMQTLKGFKVKVRTHLYRLKWDDATAYQFYESMYTDVPDETKKLAFEENRNLFKLEYVGSQLSSGSDVSFIGVNLDTPDEMIRKACVRAIDENVANLARNFEPFKVKVRLTNVAPLQAPIGLKEEITENTKFEVLLPQVVNNKTSYKRIAIIKPMRGMIWDNRYMATEEGATGSTLNYTTFTKVSGGEILPGMLIRELGKNK